MKCVECNDRNGSTRCEGCHQLFCLQCMNKHHEDLIKQFQLLIDSRNQIHESLKTIESQADNDENIPCIVDIYRWETETIRLVRNAAATA